MDPKTRPSLDLGNWLSAEPVLVAVAGDSMVPSLREGDRVEVVAASRENLVVGDIVIFRAGGQLVVHRLLAMEAEGFVEMGDNRPFGAFYPWPERMGRATALLAGDVRTELRSPAERARSSSLAARSLRRHRAELLAPRFPGRFLPRLVRALARRLP